jgi:hypothetical protein
MLTEAKTHPGGDPSRSLLSPRIAATLVFTLPLLESLAVQVASVFGAHSALLQTPATLVFLAIRLGAARLAFWSSSRRRAVAWLMGFVFVGQVISAAEMVFGMMRASSSFDVGVWLVLVSQGPSVVFSAIYYSTFVLLAWPGIARETIGSGDRVLTRCAAWTAFCAAFTILLEVWLVGTGRAYDPGYLATGLRLAVLVVLLVLAVAWRIRRARWLARVRAGAEPGWRLIDSRSAIEHGLHWDGTSGEVLVRVLPHEAGDAGVYREQERLEAVGVLARAGRPSDVAPAPVPLP